MDAGPEAPAILLLHGFTGYIGDLRYLAERFYDAGYTVLGPRLPGHGTTGEDFRASGAGDWWRAAVDGYLELADGSRRVYAAGLSMGGVLTVLLAAQFPLAGAALFAPALDFTHPLVRFTPLLQFLVPPHRVQTSEANVFDPEDPERVDPEREHLAEQYWNLQWPRQTAHLYRLARRARRALPRVTCPTLTVVSREDETVPAGVTERIRRDLGATMQKTVELTESGHVVTNGPERDEVARSVIEWFRS